MKKFLKDMIPSIIIAFSFSFMLFIYEPIIMYLSNTSDFWFDIYVLFQNTFIGFLILFVLIIFIYTLVYLLQKFIFKKFKNLYNITLIIGFILFLVTYIQGNYLSSKLPSLDGNVIEWSSYKKESIISAVLLLLASVAVIFTVVKIKFQKTVNLLKYVTLAVCVMLSVSLLSTCLTSKNGFTRKRYAVTPTANYINSYSSENNLIVFVLDSIDSETMNKIVNDNNYQSVFKDFTYYPDTVGGYAFTRDNVPLILSGYWNENIKDFATFYNEAMDKSKLLSDLDEKNYNVNIYSDEIPYNTDKARSIKNLSFDNKVNTASFLKQEVKYDLFKYLPFYLKKYSKIESMNFNYTRTKSNDELFIWENLTFMNDYLKREVDLGKDNEFKYIQIEGAHYPFNVDKNFNSKQKGTYEDKIEASITLIDKYLTYLKKNNIYDNSAIIIMSDHGFWWDIDDASLLKRQNPILYIKGFNEKHDLKVSDDKVSFAYFQIIFENLLNGVKTDKLFENIDNSKPRRFLLQRVHGYDSMEEFIQYGHSKNLKTLKSTKKIYKLEK